MMKHILPFLTAILVIPVAPATAQSDTVSRLLRQFTHPGTVAAQPPRNAVPAATVTPTATQTASLHALVVAHQPDPLIARDVAEASWLIEKLAATGACATNATAWNSLNRDAVAPRTWHRDNDDQLSIPRFNDQYHDPHSCHDVIRISNYRKPAANALAFKIYYISPQSQAARNQQFVVMKTVDGVWMVKDIGYAQSS